MKKMKISKSKDRLKTITDVDIQIILSEVFS